MKDDREWEDVRCRKCKRLLFKLTNLALRNGEALEAKCPSCNMMNYILGRPSECEDDST